MSERQDAPGLYSWLEHSPRWYEDRQDAGSTLGGHLLHYKDANPLVLGIPRGGVPVAAEVAFRLGADLDVIVARKIGAPYQRELALGAITANGTRAVNHGLIRALRITDEYLERTASEEQQEAVRREQRLRAGMEQLSTRGRTVILVDDGLATGATMRACISALKKSNVRTLVVAVPVGSVEACAAVGHLVDELVCPLRPTPFFAVGAHYRSFNQVSDEEVEALLREHRERRAELSNTSFLHSS